MYNTFICWYTNTIHDKNGLLIKKKMLQDIKKLILKRRFKSIITYNITIS